jgi:hypothetical protein
MRLAQREPDGSTLRQHLQAAARARPDCADPLLTATSVPECCSQLWEAYLDLDGSRPVGMAGPGPIPQTELAAWQVNQGVRLNSWELSTLAAMDRAALEVAAEARERERARNRRH